jgi:antitoxin ParD1/3/4
LKSRNSTLAGQSGGHLRHTIRGPNFHHQRGRYHDEDIWPSKEERDAAIAQAKALHDLAKESGLRFEAYLPPSMADWLLSLVEEGTFLDPRHAVFVMLQDVRELRKHPDMRKELLRRTLLESMDDPRPSVPLEEASERITAHLTRPRPEPAKWLRRKDVSPLDGDEVS